MGSSDTFGRFGEVMGIGDVSRCLQHTCHDVERSVIFIVKITSAASWGFCLRAYWRGMVNFI